MSESDEERPSCRCLKTHCIQRRCVCFKARYFCSDNCECLDCNNIEQYRNYVEENADLILMKNPHAFDAKVAVVEEPAQMSSVVQEAKQTFVQCSVAVPGDERLSRAKGCSCREIKCSNMNCECFKFLVGCTYKCDCEECANTFGIKWSDFISKPEICDKKNIKPELADTSGIKPEQTDTSGIKPEQIDTGGIKSEAIKMENRMQSEDVSNSYPNKLPRIWPSKHDASPP